jgi:hypothetical protein
MRRWVVAGVLAASTAAAQPGPTPVGTAPVPAPGPTPVGTAPVPAPAPAPARPRAALFAVHVAAGVSPRLAVLVGQQLRQSVGNAGYALVDDATVQAVTARSGASGGLTPDRASGLVRAAGARVGVFASVHSEPGRYLVDVQVVRADGAPPGAARASGASSDLYVDLDRALRGVLPPPGALAIALPPPVPPPAEPPSEPFPEGRWRLSIGTEAAFGVYNGQFRNHLFGARMDRRFSDDVALGLAVAYANLKGKDGRAHNVLPWALFEYRIDLGGGWAVPLRYATGFLPKNGPVVKGSAGLAIPLGDDVDLSLELLSPTVWIVQERAVLSMDLAAEIAWTL